MEIIVSHSNADFDAIAAQVGAQKLHPQGQIVLAGGQDRNVREFITLHRDLLNFVPSRQLDLSQVDSIIVVDTSISRRLGEVQSALENPGVRVVVYDHHPAGISDIHADTRIIRERGAVTTILVEEIRKRQLPVSPFEATLLALGIYEDTGSFTFSATTPEDLEAGSWLLAQGANLDVVSSFISRALTEEQRKLLNELILTAEYHTVHGVRIAVATAKSGAYIGELALLTHKLSDIENVEAVFTLARLEETIFLIGRSKTRLVDVSKLIAEFGGGGHSRAASATIRDSDLESVKSKLISLLPDKIKPEISARSIMSYPARVIRPDATIDQAGEMMAVYGHSGLSVMERGKLIGIISRRDLDKARHHGLGHAPVKGFMSRNLVTVTPETTLSEIERLMIENDVGRLPVIENNKLVGIVTRSDILRAIHGQRYAGIRRPNRPDNISEILEKQLPEDIYHLFKKIGEVAAERKTGIFVVGGFVRDLLLGVSNLDMDLLVDGNGIEMAEFLAERFGGICKPHPRFGTAVLTLPNGFKIDLASARREIYDHPAALPDVEHSSVREDLQRRDFTINAMAVQLNGERFGTLLDFYGGRRDLSHKVFRVLHNLSFIEDPTRILRAIRFEERLGFELDRHSVELAANALKEGVLNRLSGERLRDELILMLSESNASKSLNRMQEMGIPKAIHRDLELNGSLGDRIDSVRTWFHTLKVPDVIEPWMLYLGTLFSHLDSHRAREICVKRLRITEPKAEMIAVCLSSSKPVSSLLNSGDSPMPSEICNGLKSLPLTALLFALAVEDTPLARRRLSDYLLKYRSIRLKISGRDLMKLGIRPGPSFGEALQETLNAVLDGSIHTKEEELAYAKAKLLSLEGTTL